MSVFLSKSNKKIYNHLTINKIKQTNKQEITQLQIEINLCQYIESFHDALTQKGMYHFDTSLSPLYNGDFYKFPDY